MAYIKQYFEDGKVLYASQLNHIEDGIVALWESIGSNGQQQQLPAGDYPDYVRRELNRVASETQKVITSESIVSICLSDTHYYDSENTRLGGLHAAMAIKGLTYLLPIDFIAHLGDVGNESSSTDVSNLKNNITEMLGYIKEAAGTAIPLFVCIGNHDNGNYITTSNNEDMVEPAWLFENFTALSESESTVFGGQDVGGYCYRDFAQKKLRVFMLNAGEGVIVGGNANDVGTSETQRAWFAQALKNLNSKSDAADWQFIVLCHYPADYGAARPLSNLLAAYVNGTSITLNGTSYNFSGANKAKFLVQYHGHIHNFLTDRLYYGDTPTQYDVYRVCTPNAQYDRENYYGTFSGVNYAEDTSYTKTPGTANDTSFVVNVCNPSEEMIYSFHYGAGYDRTISMKGIVYHSIQTDSIGATISGSSTTVQDGGSYTGTITAMDDYTLESVVITMGGKDITATTNANGTKVYENGVINIQSVTGTVTVTVVTKEKPKNLIPLSIDVDGSLYNGGLGYKTNLRISTSSKGELDSTGSYVSGYIPYNGATLRLYNVGIDNVNGSDAFLIGFTELDQYKVSGQAKLANITKNSDGSITVKPSDFSADMTNKPYVRLSCSYIGSDSIVYKE